VPRIAATQSASPCKESPVPIRSTLRLPSRPSIPGNNTFPGRVLLALAADALQEAGVSRDNPVAYEGIRERFLPEIEFHGRVEHHKSHYALQAAAMIHGGVEPDLLGEVTWWNRDDLWLRSRYALVIYLRVAAERMGTSVGVVCQSVATRPDSMGDERPGAAAPPCVLPPQGNGKGVERGRRRRIGARGPCSGSDPVRRFGEPLSERSGGGDDEAYGADRTTAQVRAALRRVPVEHRAHGVP
jgi:hypothetical protein